MHVSRFGRIREDIQLVDPAAIERNGTLYFLKEAFRRDLYHIRLTTIIAGETAAGFTLMAESAAGRHAGLFAGSGLFLLGSGLLYMYARELRVDYIRYSRETRPYLESVLRREASKGRASKT